MFLYILVLHLMFEAKAHHDAIFSVRRLHPLILMSFKRFKRIRQTPRPAKGMDLKNAVGSEHENH